MHSSVVPLSVVRAASEILSRIVIVVRAYC